MNGYPLPPELNGVLDRAQADPAAVGLVLIGSYASGNPDGESDIDVLYVLREGPAPPREYPGRIELIFVTVDELERPVHWFKPALAHSRVLLDENGRLEAARAAAAKVSREEAAEVLDDYLNFFYRSLKAWRRGNELAARVEGVSSLRSAVDVLYALDGRRAPYPSAYRGAIGELEPLIEEIARTADPGAQQRLQAQIEERARARGYGGVYDAWTGDIETAMGFGFSDH